MLSRNLDNLSFVANVANLKLVAALGIDGEVTIVIANGTLLTALNFDGGTNNGFASLVNHNTIYTCCLLNSCYSTIRHSIVYWRISKEQRSQGRCYTHAP